MHKDGALDDQLRQRLRMPHQAAAYISRPSPRPQLRISDIYVSAKNSSKPQAYIPPKMVNPQQVVKDADRISNKSSPKVGFGLKLHHALYGLAVILFVIGISASLIGFRADHKAQAQINQINQHLQAVNDNSSAPSTSKPTAAQLSSYTVPTDLPRYIDIPSLKIHARIYPLGTTKSGALAAPNNIYNAGWYKKSSKPGQAGAMLVDGHSGVGIDGVFNGLPKLKAGDPITIKRGDGQAFVYKVVRSQIVAADKTDMSSLLVSTDTSLPGLNLISCTGDRIPGTYDLNERIEVFSVLE